MRISQRSIETVRDTVDIVEVAAEFTALRRQGARYTGLCPYPDHSEKTPSFSVSPDKGFYYCFGCGKGGDAIKLITDLKSLPFVEAVTYLAEKSGIELEFEGASGAEAQAARERNQRRRAIHRALAAATAYYHKYLLESVTPEAQRARAYLKEREIAHSTIEEFRLGLAPPRGSAGFIRVAQKLGIERTILEAAGLLSSRGGDRFSGRITFPISDRRGRIVGFGARVLGNEQPKYLNSPETEIFNKRDLLYGFPQVTDAMRRKRAALVVEGYTDVLMLYQSGIKNAVATLGTATTPGHLRTLSSYADQVCLLFDPDTAGEKAIERAAATAAELKQDLRVLRLNEDPADWLLHHTPEEFEQMLNEAVPILEYSIRRAVEHVRGAGAMERSRAVSDVQRLVCQIEDPVLHNEAVRLATEALGVNPSVFEQVRQPSRGAASSPSRMPEDGFSSPWSHAGRQVLALTLARPDLNAKLLREGVAVRWLPGALVLEADDFAEEEQASLFALLKRHPDRGPEDLLVDEDTRPLLAGIGSLYAEAEKLYPSPAVIKAAWLRLRILRREHDKRQTPDYDEKIRIHSEVQLLREALRTITEES